MNLNWSNKVIKYVLFVFNLLFVISGIVMIAVGVSVKSYYTDYDVFLSDSYFSLPNLLIAIGSLIFFISFFGCCGAIKENWFMIFIFSVLLSVIFIMEFSAGIAGYVLRDKTNSFLRDELHDSMNHYKFNQNVTNPTTAMWDVIQVTFQCCGANGPKDWISINRTEVVTDPPITQPSSTTITQPSSSETTQPSSSETTQVSSNETIKSSSTETTHSSSTETTETTEDSNKSLRRKRDLSEKDSLNSATPKTDLPSSCCKSRPGNTGQSMCNLNNTQTATYYKIGCVDGFGDYLKDHAVTLGGVAFAIAVIQLFGVILACHLTRQLKHGFYST